MSERVVVETKEPLRVLVIPDTHSPYTNAKQLAAVVEFSKEFKPNFIVQIGDAWDQYTHSKYAKSLNLKTPRNEDNEGKQIIGEMWKAFRKAAPKAEMFMLRGNHDIRAAKRILEKAPDLEDAVTAFYKDLYTFPGVKTLEDDRSELVINDILFIHGYLSNLGDHVKYNRQSTVVGHSHKGGVHFMRYNGKTLFELNAGHLANDSLLPSSYTPQRTTFWTPGFGTLVTNKAGVVVPMFVPL